jgi:hypothetical protein
MQDRSPSMTLGERLADERERWILWSPVGLLAGIAA